MTEFYVTADISVVHGPARCDSTCASCREHLNLLFLTQGREKLFGVPDNRVTRKLGGGSVLDFANMKKGDPLSAGTRVEQLRKRVEKHQEAIVAKCNPAIFELAQLWKESIAEVNSLGASPPKEVVAGIEARFDTRLNEVQRKYSGNVPPAPNSFAAQVLFSDAVLQSKSDHQGVAEWMHFERHRTPLKVDVEKRRSRDYGASRRILRTAADLEALRCSRRILPFKGETEHRGMFETLWGFGIDRLTPEELAIFFDEYCPCGEIHDPDALKKSRKRFMRLLQSAIK